MYAEFLITLNQALFLVQTSKGIILRGTKGSVCG